MRPCEGRVGRQGMMGQLWGVDSLSDRLSHPQRSLSGRVAGMLGIPGRAAGAHPIHLEQ